MPIDFAIWHSQGDQVPAHVDAFFLGYQHAHHVHSTFFPHVPPAVYSSPLEDAQALIQEINAAGVKNPVRKTVVDGADLFSPLPLKAAPDEESVETGSLSKEANDSGITGKAGTNILAGAAFGEELITKAPTMILAGKGLHLAVDKVGDLASLAKQPIIDFVQHDIRPLMGDTMDSVQNLGQMGGKQVVKTMYQTLRFYIQSFSAVNKGGMYIAQEILHALGPQGAIGAKTIAASKAIFPHLAHIFDIMKSPLLKGTSGFAKAIVFGKIIQFILNKSDLLHLQYSIYRNKVRKLDHKLVMNFLTPGIEKTDIIDERWDCPSGFQTLMGKEKWWMHPSIHFTNPQTIIHVHLQELGDTAGPGCNVYWDAVYNLDGGKVLKNSDEALFGQWPYFVRHCNQFEPIGDEASRSKMVETGWCNVDNHGQDMHPYLLTVTGGDDSLPVATAMINYYPHDNLQVL
eukprot:GEMP01020187.1.p1 GENE.GEMP01020187.1~~GEMP01020187.1.p1  ORF type:complete len:458 (+),score=68.76 GEMP01020187.1:472-1845(+)